MVRLEHANLVVGNIDSTLSFLQLAFPQWRVRGSDTNVWRGKPRNWLHFGDDNYYITLNDGAVGQNRDLDGHSPGLAHIGFEVEDVDGIIDRLTGAGFEISVLSNDHPYRSTVYFKDPEGFEFEFMQYLSNKPEERNIYQSNGSTLVDNTSQQKPIAHQE